ncbi:hypothetical protein XENOCAPTIV_023123 [Xenoophorus captivus]|uniref:Ig-like domain-containing protein n=1 Tax=Xenoophorus captivus TaxID=1517983 RepID=A0ABV0SBD3_9TELE
MDLLSVVLLTVLACSEAQNMINVTGELGQDVPLTCSFSSPDIFWFMEVQNRISAGIGRTYSSVPTYFSPDLETKYSISEKKLLVRNLSAEDSRFYFCGRKDDGRTVYGDTIRLIISDAQNVMELKAELGQDVTLTCSFSHPEIFWYMEINNKPRLGIGSTYASSFPTFSSPGFGSRYSLVENKLLIRNFSVEDGGLYFCGKKIRGAMIYGEPIRVVPGK